MQDTLIIPRYISAEEFDLMFDDELDKFFSADYEQEDYFLEKQINNSKNNNDENN